MTNPTSNYNFQMPTATDLVTDLPADFEVFGQAVDTRLKALQPGTTLGDLAYSSATANTNTRLPVGTNGQVLAVVAGVPAWQNGTTGDIEGVTAGVGISGGGTSGTVTVTNSMATAIDAKGDLIVGTGADAFARLAVGATNGHVLTVDSAEATGLKYASAGASFVGVSLYNTTSQSIPDSTATAMTYNSEEYDTDGFHSTVTNTERITIPAGKAGKYLLTGVMYYSANTTGFRLLDFQINGSSNPGTAVDATNGAAGAQTICLVRTLAVSDYVSIRAYQTSGGNLNNNNTFFGSFTATYLGA